MRELPPARVTRPKQPGRHSAILGGIEAPAGVAHWIAYGIPASVTEFKEGDVSKAAANLYVGGKSTMGVGNYTGPCTPAGIGLHHYTFILMATDLEPTALQPGMTRDELVPALKGHVKGTTGIIGKFGRD